MARTRFTISRAERRVNVKSRIRSGVTPRSRRTCARAVSVVVLPVPGPAMIRNGPAPNVAASRCRALRSRCKANIRSTLSLGPDMVVARADEDGASRSDHLFNLLRDPFLATTEIEESDERGEKCRRGGRPVE